MNDLWYRYNDLSPVARIAIIGTLVLVLASCSLLAFANIRSSGNASNKTQKTLVSASTSENAMPVSRFIFGTNLSPQVLTSTSTQRLLQQMHIQMIRIPMNKPFTEAVIAQAAQEVKRLNAVPLVNLYDPLYPKSQEENSKIVQTMNSVFGQATVYYEYGSEDDAIGMSAEDYVAAWNQAIPKLKQLAPGAHFVGPATYRYTARYLQTFLQQAHPLPDDVSWHEYACNASESQGVCMQRINNWHDDVVNARATMLNIVGKPLPIIISEWNYAADAKPGDGKSNDPQFLTAWTAHALQTMSDNQIFASMQYFCTGVTPLISNNALTPQGQVFTAQYERDFASPQQTTSTTPTTITPTAAPTTPTTTLQSTPTPTQITEAPPTSIPPTDTPTTVLAPTPTTLPTPIATPTLVPTHAATPNATSATRQPPHIIPTMTPAQIYQTATSGPLLYNSALLQQDTTTWRETAFSGGGSCGFTGNSYQASMPQRNYFAPCLNQTLSYNNFTMQVEMTITAGTVNDGGGLIFRATGNGDYRFRVNLDGSWDLAPLNIGGLSAAIKRGLNQTNIVTIVVEGSDIYLFVNQIYLTHVTDASFTSGQLGLMAVDWNSTTTATFKNVNIWQLS